MYQQFQTDSQSKSWRDIYQEIGVLGEGAFGKVYKAVNIANRSQIVAVKVMNISKSQESKIFDSETKCLKQLKMQRQRNQQNLAQDPQSALDLQKKQGLDHLLELVDVFKIPGNDEAAIIMKYYENSQPLDEFLLNPTNAKLTENQKLKYFLHILLGLSFMHSIGMYHRDLKLANFLYVPDTDSVVIIDFGLAVTGRDGEFQSEQAGTRLFSSPQQLKMDPSSAEKNDIWALGVVLYFMLYNKHPLNTSDSRSIEELMKNADRLMKMEYTIPIDSASSQEAQSIFQKTLGVREITRDKAENLAESLKNYLETQEKTAKVNANKLVTQYPSKQEAMQVTSKIAESTISMTPRPLFGLLKVPQKNQAASNEGGMKSQQNSTQQGVSMQQQLQTQNIAFGLKKQASSLQQFQIYQQTQQPQLLQQTQQQPQQLEQTKQSQQSAYFPQKLQMQQQPNGNLQQQGQLLFSQYQNQSFQQFQSQAQPFQQQPQQLQQYSLQGSQQQGQQGQQMQAQAQPSWIKQNIQQSQSQIKSEQQQASQLQQSSPPQQQQQLYQKQQQPQQLLQQQQQQQLQLQPQQFGPNSQQQEKPQQQQFFTQKWQQLGNQQQQQQQQQSQLPIQPQPQQMSSFSPSNPLVNKPSNTFNNQNNSKIVSVPTSSPNVTPLSFKIRDSSVIQTISQNPSNPVQTQSTEPNNFYNPNQESKITLSDIWIGINPSLINTLLNNGKPLKNLEAQSWISSAPQPISSETFNKTVSESITSFLGSIAELQKIILQIQNCKNANFLEISSILSKEDTKSLKILLFLQFYITKLAIFLVQTSCSYILIEEQTIVDDSSNFLLQAMQISASQFDLSFSDLQPKAKELSKSLIELKAQIFSLLGSTSNDSNGASLYFGNHAQPSQIKSAVGLSKIFNQHNSSIITLNQNSVPCKSLCSLRNNEQQSMIQVDQESKLYEQSTPKPNKLLSQFVRHSHLSFPMGNRKEFNNFLMTLYHLANYVEKQHVQTEYLTQKSDSLSRIFKDIYAKTSLLFFEPQDPKDNNSSTIVLRSIIVEQKKQNESKESTVYQEY